MIETNPHSIANRTVVPPSAGELPLPPFPWQENIERLLGAYERRLIRHALAQADGVKRHAASLLGISRYALERRLHRLAKLFDRGEAPPPAAAEPQRRLVDASAPPRAG